MIPSLIRTYSHWVVVWIVGWLTALGIDVSDEQQTALVGVIAMAAGWLWYALVRWLERRWPALSVLLGSRQQPGYAADNTKAKG